MIAIQIIKLQLKGNFARLRKSSFVKNVLVVMSGTAAAQMIGFAMSPIISRLFTPSDFGVFGSFNAVLGVIAAGVTLDYSQAVVLPKEKEDAINLFFVSCLCTLCVGILCLIVCLIVPNSINGLMRTNGIWALALIFIATIITGLNTSTQAWCIRIKAFKATSSSQVIRSLSSNGSQIAFGFLKGGAPGLIVSSVLADILASLNLFREVLSDIKTLRQGFQLDKIRQILKEYRDFPMYSASQNVINALSNGLPVLLLTHYYGVAVAGGYSFGMRILNVPMGFVLRALRQVLFQKASETQHQGGNLTKIYFKVSTGLFVLAFFPTLVIFIWGPQLFAYVFSSEWHLAGELASWLVIWMMFSFCNLPAVLFARLIRIQRMVFYYDLILLTVRILTLVLGGLYLNVLQTIMFFSIVGAVMNLILILLVGHAVMKKEGHINLERIRNSLFKG